MKWIKKFNEELSPQTYRTAASVFRKYGKSQSIEKANKLEDWANQQEFGLYNMHFVCGTSKVVTGSFTEPKLIGIYYGNVPGDKSTDPQYSEFIRSSNLLYVKETDEKAEVLVDEWIQGGDELSITFEFGLKPTNETIVASKNHSWLVNCNKGGRYIQEVPIFSVELLLSDWTEGLEEYDSEARYQHDDETGEFLSTTISEFFENMNYNEWIVRKPLCQYYSAIFSDRRSAQKFLTFFQQTITSEKVKDVIMDILRIIGPNSSHLENTLNCYKKVRVHGFYDEKLSTLPSGKSFNDIWFNRRID